jgi:hypothetical protein
MSSGNKSGMKETGKLLHDTKIRHACNSAGGPARATRTESELKDWCGRIGLYQENRGLLRQAVESAGFHRMGLAGSRSIISTMEQTTCSRKKAGLE